MSSTIHLKSTTFWAVLTFLRAAAEQLSFDLGRLGEGSEVSARTFDKETVVEEARGSTSSSSCWEWCINRCRLAAATPWPVYGCSSWMSSRLGKVPTRQPEDIKVLARGGTVLLLTFPLERENARLAWEGERISGPRTHPDWGRKHLKISMLLYILYIF